MESKSHWNLPGTTPTEPGEYRAALEPREAAPTARRFWDGKHWSNPYHSTSPESVKARARAEKSEFLVFWQDALNR